jgi:hypothetical protein
LTGSFASPHAYLAVVALSAATLAFSLVSANGREITTVITTYSISESDVIGNLKLGILCAPGGRIKWGNVKVPRDADFEQNANELITGLLLKDEERPSRLVAKVLAVRLKLCTRKLGVGPPPKGIITIKVEWRSGESQQQPVKPIEITIPFQQHDPRQDSKPMSDALLLSLETHLKAR